MDIEYEATYLNIDKDQVRAQLKQAGAKLIRPEFLQKRFCYSLPKGHEIKGGWVRIRNEGDKITLSLKVIDGDNINDQRETILKIDNMEEAREFLKTLGCKEKAYQETKRELWKIDGVEITIDEWPFIEPCVEVEGNSEAEVEAVSKKLGFDYSQAKFCAIGKIYSEKYNIPQDLIDNKTPKLVFDMENPFVDRTS